MFGGSGGLGVLVLSGELQALAKFWKGPNFPLLCVCVKVHIRHINRCAMGTICYVCVCVCVCVRYIVGTSPAAPGPCSLSHEFRTSLLCGDQLLACVPWCVRATRSFSGKAAT
jgi:hypothetical protein